MNSVGIVLIGQNPGARLDRALDAALKQTARVVYVDSGSTDGSIGRAEAHGAAVVALDASQPYTAARARNAGAQFLLQQDPAPEFFLFVDGDCLLAEGFIRVARAVMESDPCIAVVCGQRRERFPEVSVYQELLALEWQAPVGEILYFGGDAMVRIGAFVRVNGYNADLIAGEEPDLSLRLRRAGWKIWGIDAVMTYHDAQMTHFREWWERSARAGYAYAEGAWRQGRAPERHWVHESASIWFWGAGVWLGAVGLAKPTRGASFALLLGYPFLAARIYARRRAEGWGERSARLYAVFCVLAKFPQLQGQMRFVSSRVRGRLTALNGQRV